MKKYPACKEFIISGSVDFEVELMSRLYVVDVMSCQSLMYIYDVYFVCFVCPQYRRLGHISFLVCLCLKQSLIFPLLNLELLYFTCLCHV